MIERELTDKEVSLLDRAWRRSSVTDKMITDEMVERAARVLAGHLFDEAFEGDAESEWCRLQGVTREALERAVTVKPHEWHAMDTAPKDGAHCILAIKSGPFVYAIQGAFMQGKWMNAADIESEPLCWMPNFRIPSEFLPWEN